MEYVDIDSIIPADYNPREITREKELQLQESIKLNGFCLPVLVRRENNKIIAGHQRCNAAKALGIKKVPVFFIEGISDTDERVFNQLHNGCDFDKNAHAFLKQEIPYGFSLQHNEIFEVKTAFPRFIGELSKLILKYGNVFCAVVSAGEVIIGVNYVRACQLLGIDCNVYKVEKVTPHGVNLLKDEYGVYSYEKLPKNTWCQGLAQLNRSVNEKPGKKAYHSTLYENKVLPYLKSHPGLKVLDFGCGKGAYIDYVKASGLAKIAIGIEFYNNNGKSILVKKAQEQISKLIVALNEYGLFDVVVCDSVLNSVDSIKAESAVIDCVNLFLKPNGRAFFSGRRSEFEIEEKNKMRRFDVSSKIGISMVDKNGFTALFRNGNWFYQKFHTQKEACALITAHGFSAKYSAVNTSAWHIEAIKLDELPFEKRKSAIEFEFNLPLPNGKTFNRHNEVISAYKIAIKKDEPLTN